MATQQFYKLLVH